MRVYLYKRGEVVGEGYVFADSITFQLFSNLTHTRTESLEKVRKSYKVSYQND